MTDSADRFLFPFECHVLLGIELLNDSSFSLRDTLSCDPVVKTRSCFAARAFFSLRDTLSCDPVVKTRSCFAASAFFSLRDTLSCVQDPVEDALVLRSERVLQSLSSSGGALILGSERALPAPGSGKDAVWQRRCLEDRKNSKSLPIHASMAATILH